MTDAERTQRNDEADNLRDARERYDVAIEEAKRAPIGTDEFRDAMAEARSAEKGVEDAGRS